MVGSRVSVMRRKVAESNSGSGEMAGDFALELGPLLRLVKNLRGVICAARPSEAAGHIAWVRKKFQYRSIGYTPFMEEKFRRARLTPVSLAS